MRKSVKIILGSILLGIALAIIMVYLRYRGIPPDTVQTDIEKRMLAEALGILPTAPRILKYEIGWTDSTFYYCFSMTDQEYSSIITNGWESISGRNRRYGPLWWRPPGASPNWTFHKRLKPQYGELIRNNQSGLTYFMTFHE